MSIREKPGEFDRKEKEKAGKQLTNEELHTSDAQTLIRLVNNWISLLEEG